MTASDTSRLLVLAISAGLMTAHADSFTAVPRNRLQADSAGVQIVVDVEKETYRADQGPSFTISLRNSGSKNLLLNAGGLLGNGQEIWSSIKCEIRSTDGRRVPLAMSWGVSRVAGRIYFLGVPLRPASVYTIAVTPRDYYFGKGEPVEAGVYGLGCTYSGAQSTFRDSTQLPQCWEGVATSNISRVEIIRAER